MKIILFCFFYFVLLFSASAAPKISAGLWHAHFQLNETTALPIQFSVDRKSGQYEITIYNADEKIQLTTFQIQNDSIIIGSPTFDSEFRIKIEGKKKITGKWHNYVKGPDYAIPFTAERSKEARFTNSNKINNKIYGKWEVTFDYDEHPEKAIGIFDPWTDKVSNGVKGTFLTETGDYRYLEGNICSDSMMLSTFDGSHAFLFRSKLVNDTLWGDFLSGSHYKTKWYAVRNDDVELRHPDSLTYLVNNDPITLCLKDLNNEHFHYPNGETEGKVTLIQIMGTWCPNCLDESRYLSEQQARFGDDLSILAVTFEAQSTEEARRHAVQNYKDNLELDYTFLLGGKASKKEASELFPMLNSIISFPTLIFIDKKGMVRKIHTGFSGPGTGDYYDMFVEKTNMMLDQMINE